MYWDVQFSSGARADKAVRSSSPAMSFTGRNLVSSTTRPVPALPRSRAAPPGGRRWLPLAALAVSLLVVGLDTTVLNVALPALVSELGASAQESAGTALAVAEKLPGETGAAFADAARRAFTDGMGPATAAAVGVMALGIAAALALAPSRPTGSATDRRTNSEESS